MSDIFLSYDRDDRPRVELLAALLEQRGWSIWWDRDIRAGEDYRSTILAALGASRCVIVVWSRNSIASPWVRDEAEVARRRTALVPVRIDPVEPPLGFGQLQTADLTDWDPAAPGPVFERLVADLASKLGRPAADREEQREQPPAPGSRRLTFEGRRRIVLAGFAMAAVAGGAYALYRRVPVPPVNEHIVAPPRMPEPEVAWPAPDDRVALALGRCTGTWKSRERALAAQPGDGEVLRAQADCGMLLLENARLTGADARFSDFVEPITPVLHAALEGARGRRAADLLAHLGWADFLKSRDGVGGLRPESSYRLALEQEPDNPYANAMWGHSILWQHGSLAEAQSRFQRALASGREREFVRRFQLAALTLYSDAPLEYEAIRVANEMRGNGEPVPTNDPERQVWSTYWTLYYRYLLDDAQRQAFLAILPPAEHLATFRWLLPESQTPQDKRELWVLFLATFQELSGDRLTARSNYEWLRAELTSREASGPLLDRTDEGLRRLAAGR